MSDYRDILQGFKIDEFHATDERKQALRACAEILLTTSEDYATASTLALLMVVNKQDGVRTDRSFHRTASFKSPEGV